MGNHNHLSLLERQNLYMSKQQGVAIVSITKQLNRDRSTIYRELARHQIDGTYNPIAAEAQAMAS